MSAKRWLVLAVMLFLPAALGAAVERLTLKVEGMTCLKCEMAVAGSALRVPGVTEAKADVKAGVLVCTFDPERAAPADIAASIRKAGYRTPEHPSPEEKPAG